MTLESTIQHSLLHYPDLYQARWQVLDHLFCVIGNGYEWRNGVLVLKEKPKRPVATYDNRIKDQDRFDKEHVHLAGYRGTKKQRISKMKTQDTARFMQPALFYPLSEYSKMVTFPDDIKIDWLFGVLEICNLIILSEGRTAGSDKTKSAAIKQVDIAMKVYERAKKVRDQKFFL